MRIVQINTFQNSRAPGRIAESIGKLVLAEGWQNYFAAGPRHRNPTASQEIKMGGLADTLFHGAGSVLADAHGLFSKSATERLVERLEEIKPDLIHLHNLHGYYLNISILFSYLQEKNLPVVWTLHDCWAYTGHCVYYSFAGCEKWQTECNNCPQTFTYPKSITDKSRRNFLLKKELLSKIDNLTICTPSQWLADEVKKSFLGSKEIRVIRNGINLNVFKPEASEQVIAKYNLQGKKIILGVASTWSKRKGLNDFIQLANMLDNNHFQIVLVGVDRKQGKTLPENIKTIPRTESQQELAQIYSAAEFFFNPTYEDNYPTTNLEALACGTPVVTYRTGGSPEAVQCGGGFVVEQGDIKGAVEVFLSNEKKILSSECREIASKFFDEEKLYKKYIDLYQEQLISKQ